MKDTCEIPRRCAIEKFKTEIEREKEEKKLSFSSSMQIIYTEIVI
jgi:hypothetical protein